MDAFNALPEKREKLIRLEERVRWGGLDKADDMLNRIEAEMENLSSAATDDGSLNTEAEEQLKALCSAWAAASEQRAIYADKLLHIRNLQDRITAMKTGSAERPYCENSSGRCDKPDLFFSLTRPDYPKGKVSACTDDDVIRFVEKVEIGEETVTVIFKAGVSVELKRGK